MNTNMLPSKIIAGVMLKVMNKLIPGLRRYFKVILLLFLPLTWSQTLAGEMSIVASGTWPACDCNDSNCYKAEVVSNGFKISGNGIVTQELLLMPSRVYSSYGAGFQILDSNNNWGPWQWWGHWKDGCKGSWQVLENDGKDVKGEPFRSYTKYKVTNAECDQERRLVVYPQQSYGALGSCSQAATTNTFRVTFTPDVEPPPPDECELPSVCPWEVKKQPEAGPYQADQNIQFSIAEGVNNYLISHPECKGGEQNTYWNFGDGQTSAGLDNKTVNHAYDYADEFNVTSVFQFTFPNSATHPTAECYVETSVIVGGQTLPDLMITSITSPTTGEAGGSIPTQVIIKNQGALDAGAFGLAFLLSKDASITLSDINTGIGCSFSSLAKGASYNCSGSIKIPENTPDGIYYFGAYVDSGQHITESNEANNGLAAAHTITIGGGGGSGWPDLQPTKVTSPTTANAEGVIDASAIIANQGQLVAEDFWVDYFLSGDKNIQLSDLNTGFGCYFTNLAPTSNDTCLSSITIPPFTPNGNYYLGVYADPYKSVTELDVLNNGLAAGNTINISGGDESFQDVPKSNWAYWYIHVMRYAGITNGCGNGNFCPSGLVTRDQMAAFLVRAIEGDPQSNLCAAGSPFSDVPWNVWYCSHVKRLVDQAITGGCGQGKYCPGNLVTREQMAAFIVRAKEGEPPQNYCGGVAPFNDVSASAWSCGYIKKLVELGITQGCGSGNYCPTASVTREQMAAFLARAFLYMD